jgi:hypothetical protein
MRNETETLATRRVTLKRLKVARHLSEDTTAFTADVCLDGKTVAHAKNAGTGATKVQLLRDGMEPTLEAAAHETLVAMAEYADQRDLTEAVVDALVDAFVAASQAK